MQSADDRRFRITVHGPGSVQELFENLNLRRGDARNAVIASRYPNPELSFTLHASRFTP